MFSRRNGRLYCKSGGVTTELGQLINKQIVQYEIEPRELLFDEECKFNCATVVLVLLDIDYNLNMEFQLNLTPPERN